jgi:hypothetical protein
MNASMLACGSRCPRMYNHLNLSWLKSIRSSHFTGRAGEQQIGLFQQPASRIRQSGREVYASFQGLGACGAAVNMARMADGVMTALGELIVSQLPRVGGYHDTSGSAHQVRAAHAATTQ